MNRELHLDDYSGPRDGNRKVHQSLFLPAFLAKRSKDERLRGPDWDNARDVVNKWADLEHTGKLKKMTETALEGEFLHDIFGSALGYTLFSENLDTWHVQPKYSIDGMQADAALGVFRHDQKVAPAAVIELKGPTVNLDRDRFNGRTPVQQCWDYLNQLPGCQWGIVSNYVSVRLYHRDHTPRNYQLFVLQDLRKEETFAEFYYLLEREGLLEIFPGRKPRAVELLEETGASQEKVGEELYNYYDSHRKELILLLTRPPHSKPLDQAIRIAQKIIDRIIFVAFCEDRGLLPQNSISKAYSQLPAFARVTNPKWQNFLDLFQSVDKGNPTFGIAAFNGGLFRSDPDVDNLQLDDDYTGFFKRISDYDFKDQVNVEVLGHLFEKSVNDIERIRLGGLFEAEYPDSQAPKMGKSAERKRTGIYYTPPAFTEFIVRRTIGELIRERLATIATKHGLKSDEAIDLKPGKEAASYWRDCLASLRSLRIVDPACGSGAFLISAYELLDEVYRDVAYYIELCEGDKRSEVTNQIPDIILHENLYGVDLSKEAVEITQLALWIRSAREGKTLADLSENIVCGNSLVSDLQVHPDALDWHKRFSSVFDRSEKGFDCVIGNPPWERMKLQEREFFDGRDESIATAVSAAQRRKLIEKLKTTNPALYERYEGAKREAEQSLNSVRTSGRFPLTGKGDINTYAAFAELAAQIVSQAGRVGLLVPSGIATDDSTKEFFGSLLAGNRLMAVYDFENRHKIFPDVDGRFKFSVLLSGGSRAASSEMDFVFFAHEIEELETKSRHVKLSAADIALVNPNTKTLPIFRSQRDADITTAIYRRVPVLLDQIRKEGGNPWGVRFSRMFDQTNDAELFHTLDQLKKMGFKRDGPIWKKGKAKFLPLYEAKMVQMYDHRAASVVVKGENWMRQGQTREATLVEHQNPEYFAQPRWWVEQDVVKTVLETRLSIPRVAFKDVTSPTNQRTVIASFVPQSGVLNSAPLILTDPSHAKRAEACLLADLNSLALDFVARQKVGGLHLNFFIVEQFPIFPPDFYADRCPWDKRQTLEKWVSDRVLKLTCTSNDMIPLAEACEFSPSVHPWKPAERAELMAELDAAYFILYGIEREDVEYVLSTFNITQTAAVDMFGDATKADLILKQYDRLRRS